MSLTEFGINYGTKVSLVPYEEKYSALLFQFRNHPGIIKYTRQYSTLDQRPHLEYWDNVQNNDFIMHKMFMLGVYHPTSGRLIIIGVAGLTNIDWVNSHAEFSLYVAPKHQDQGYGSQAFYTLLKHGFEAFNLHKIWGESFEGNPAIKMFSNLGMTITPGHRHHYYREGKYIDSVFSHILEQEFYGHENDDRYQHLKIRN